MLISFKQNIMIIATNILNIGLLEWFGYFASVVIAISLMMNSILRLRWINLVGASMFAIYGFMIGAIPVGVLNSFIALIDIYFLFKLYKNKNEYFTTLKIRGNNKYLLAFLDYHKTEIEQTFSGFKYNPYLNLVSFFVLRNMAVASIFLAREFDKETMLIGLDFAIPEYRDFKIGSFIYEKRREDFINLGYSKLCSYAKTKSHKTYLKKMGFVESDKVANGKTLFFLNLK